MDGFPRVDGSGAMRMSMVQSEDDVSCSYFSYKACKGLNVKSIDSLWIRLLHAISRLREICPMKHGPIPCLDKPVRARSMRAGTLFSGRHFSVGRSREKFKASQAYHFVRVSSGYVKCDWVYSAGQVQSPIERHLFEVNRPAAIT